MDNIEKKVEEVKEPVVVKKAAAAPKAVATPKVAAVKEKGVTLKNTSGKEVSTSAYFYKGILPSGFEGTCGNPVEREDLLSVFNKVFKPEDNILFYKQADKEVYLVIIPLKYSDSVGDEHDSVDGDFQKHAISFLTEGSVNLDSLRQKLDRIKKFVKYTDR
jgi:hypothetical protein